MCSRRKILFLLNVYATISTQMKTSPNFIFQIPLFNQYNAQSILSISLDAL